MWVRKGIRGWMRWWMKGIETVCERVNIIWVDIMCVDVNHVESMWYVDHDNVTIK